MGGVASDEVLEYLNQLGKAYQEEATLYLIGGSALCLLGNPRRTMDIDISLASPAENQALLDAMTTIASEMKVELEVITIEEFVPTPAGASQRHQFIGQFDKIAAFIYDPYTLALSKLARGLETDIQDVLFLLANGIIEMAKLESIVEDAVPFAWEKDVDPNDLEKYLAEVKKHHQNVA
jgi:hypothetical protein